MPRRRVRFDRIRCFQFAAWAAARPKAPTSLEIATFLGTSLVTARQWRQDWLTFHTPTDSSLRGCNSGTTSSPEGTTP